MYENDDDVVAGRRKVGNFLYWALRNQGTPEISGDFDEGEISFDGMMTSDDPPDEDTAVYSVTVTVSVRRGSLFTDHLGREW